MASKQMSLKSLQRAIAKEKSKVRGLQERERLEKQLRQLKREGKMDIGGRIGRGFIILSKKAGKAAVKQAQLIRERQIQESKRTKKRKGGGGFDPLGSLDF